jgi:hexosaminidase
VRDLGREPAVWDEALDSPGIAEEAIVFAWRGKVNGERAVKAGHRVVMAPNDTTYFDHRQTREQTGPGMEGHTPWQKVASFDPIPAGLSPAQADRILGGEGLLWTEYVTTQDDIEALVLPRMAALAGRLWGYRFEDFFAKQRPMLDGSQVKYFVEPPLGLVDKRVFLESATVTLAPSPLFTDGVVRFTTDGSDPTATSPPFEKPFEVRATTKVSARVFLPGGRASGVARGVFAKEALRPARTPPANVTNGASYKYYEGDFHTVPDFGKLKPKDAGHIHPKIAFGLLGNFRPEHFAVLYEAWFVAPSDGIYRFTVRADDGVRLAIDDEEIAVDDGEHPARETEGEIALAKGHHAFRLGYFQGGFGRELDVKCVGPEGPSLSLVSP